MVGSKGGRNREAKQKPNNTALGCEVTSVTGTGIHKPSPESAYRFLLDLNCAKVGGGLISKDIGCGQTARLSETRWKP